MKVCWVRRVVVMLAVLAVTSCSDPDPDTELREALAATFGDAVAFTVEVSGSDGTSAGVEVAGLLEGARITGARDAAGETAIAYDIGAEAPLFEIRLTVGSGPRLRMGLADLLGIPDGADPEAAVGPLLDARDVTGERRAALLAGFSGDWIELDDVEALGALGSGAPPPGAGDEDAAEDAAQDEDAAATSGGDWLDAATVVEVSGDGENRTFDVRVDVPALRDALTARLGSPLLGAQVPTDAPATVTEVDGRITTIEVDLGAEDPGTQARLQVDLDEHGSATVGPPPEPVARVSTADLAGLVDVLESGG